MGYEDVKDKMNVDVGVDIYGEIIGVPPKLVVSNAEVAEVRRERAVEQERLEQQQLMMQAAESFAGAAKDGAGALADIGSIGQGGSPGG